MHNFRNVILLIVIFLLIFGGVWYFVFFKNVDIDEPNGSEIITTENTETKIFELPEWYENDKDGDGLDDATEDELGTDKYMSDTDGDGVSDKDEIEKFKTDPTNVDTDGDGHRDGVEIFNGYNPAGEGALNIPDNQ